MVKTDFYLYKGTFRWLFLGELKVFIRKIYPTVGGKVLAGLPKQHFTPPVERFDDKTNVSKRINTFVLFVLWAKTLRTFGEKISATLSKLTSGCLRGHFEKKQLFWKFQMFLLIVFGLPANFFQNLVKRFQHDCSNCWRKTKLLKIIFFKITFAHWPKKLRSPGKLNFSRVFKFELYVSRGKFWGFFSKIKHKWPLIVSRLSSKSFVLSVKVSSRFIKTALIVGRRMFWGLFWEIWFFPHHFCTISKKLNQLLAESFR